jgi:hypothetical protein
MEPGYHRSDACCFIVKLPESVSPLTLARYPEIANLLSLENVSRTVTRRDLRGDHAVEWFEHRGYSGIGLAAGWVIAFYSAIAAHGLSAAPPQERQPAQRDSRF